MSSPPSKPTPSSPPAPVDGALFRAILALSFLAVMVLAVFFWQARRLGDDSDGSVTPGGGGTQIIPPRVAFRDVTREAGVVFVHDNGARGEKLLPETMGGGVALFDADNDDDPDLVFVNGAPWQDDPAPEAARSSLVFYRNESERPGELRFRDSTEGSGLESRFYGMGVAAGDFDNDGWVDLYITAVGANRLYRNQGDGTFHDVTEASGTGGGGDAWSTSAAWFDADNDGDLDLFVCNYVAWTRAIDLAVNYELPGVGKAYGPPFAFAGTFPYLFRNEGGGRFADVTAASGLQLTNRATGQPLAKSLGVTPVDVDEDGWMDLVVANDTVQNFVFLNRRDGTFAEVGASAGIAFDGFGGTRGAMGIDTARSGGANELAIAIGNFANEMTALYVSEAGTAGRPAPAALQFSDQAIQQGIGSASRHALTFGVFFFDYDLDGWEDLLTVNGHIEPDVARFDTTQAYRQSAQLFWNAHLRTRGFVPVSESHAGPDLFQSLAGRGSAFGDMDGDGDLDVVLTQIGGPARVLENRLGSDGRWTRLKLAGSRSNRDAIGAGIRFESAGRVRWRRVMPTRGYLSQSELPVTLGLGEAMAISRIEVHWPGGGVQSVPPPSPGRLIKVVEGR